MTMKINSENQIFDPIAAIRNALTQGPKGVIDQINIAVDVLGFDAQRVYNAMRQNPDYASITHASTDVRLSYLLSYRIDEHAYSFLGYSADNSDDPRAIRRSSMLEALQLLGGEVEAYAVSVVEDLQDRPNKKLNENEKDYIVDSLVAKLLTEIDFDHEQTIPFQKLYASFICMFR